MMRMGALGKVVHQFIDACSHIFFTMMNILMKVAPIGAGGAMVAKRHRSQQHALADAQIGNVFADFRDLACHIAARNVRKRNRHVGQATANPEIEMIQRARFHTYEDVIRAEHRLRRVGTFQDLGSAVLMENNRFHETSAFRLAKTEPYHRAGSVSRKPCALTAETGRRRLAGEEARGPVRRNRKDAAWGSARGASHHRAYEWLNPEL